MVVARSLSHPLRSLGPVFLPLTCPCCGAAGAAPCLVCRAQLSPASAAAPPPGVDGWWALLRYEGAGRDLVVHLKYRNARSSIRWLAEAMAALVDPTGIDVVTWAPTTPSVAASEASTRPSSLPGRWPGVCTCRVADCSGEARDQHRPDARARNGTTP